MLVRLRMMIPVLAVALIPAGLAGRQQERPCSRYLYGLYNAETNNESSYRGFVISPNGKPVQPQANDPDEPSAPGFYDGKRHFAFAYSRFSTQGFSLKTVAIGGEAFSFKGRFRCEQNELGEQPYLEGELSEWRNGRVIRKQQIQFWHAAAE